MNIWIALFIWWLFSAVIILSYLEINFYRRETVLDKTFKELTNKQLLFLLVCLPVTLTGYPVMKLGKIWDDSKVKVKLRKWLNDKPLK